MTEQTKNESAESKPAKSEEISSTRSTQLIVVMIAIGILVGGVFYLVNKNSGSTSDEPAAATDTLGGLLEGDLNDPVARVNDVSIPLRRYQDRVKDFADNVVFQGLSLEDEVIRQQIREQALASLINTEILLQAATAANITVTDEEIEAAYQTAASNFGGATGLEQALSELGFTEEELLEDIRGQLIIDAYLQETIDIDGVTVTDDEVSNYYNELSSSNTEAPDFEEVSEIIREQLVIQKQQELLGGLIDSLRTEANVETLI